MGEKMQEYLQKSKIYFLTSSKTLKISFFIIIKTSKKPTSNKILSNLLIKTNSKRIYLIQKYSIYGN